MAGVWQGCDLMCVQRAAVIKGLAGLVGVGLVGVAWESSCSTSQHMDMMRTLAYLVAGKMEKVRTE